MVKLAGQDRYLARSRTHEPGSYFELWVSPGGDVRCTCPSFTYRGICKHAEALRGKLEKDSFVAAVRVFRLALRGGMCSRFSH